VSHSLPRPSLATGMRPCAPSEDSPDDILAKLQEAGRHNLGDFMTFEVGPDDDHPETQNDGMRYHRLRFRAECRLAGKVYGQSFGVDVAFGDPILGEPDVVVAEDVLAFAGIAPPSLRLYPVVTHVAEKLHAYTMPRSRPNSRVKDLPDLALLATAQALDAKRLRGKVPTRRWRGKISSPGPRWGTSRRRCGHSSTPCWRSRRNMDSRELGLGAS